MLDLDKRKELHCPKCGKPLVIYQTAEGCARFAGCGRNCLELYDIPDGSVAFGVAGTPHFLSAPREQAPVVRVRASVRVRSGEPSIEEKFRDAGVYCETGGLVLAPLSDCGSGLTQLLQPLEQAVAVGHGVDLGFPFLVDASPFDPVALSFVRHHEMTGRDRNRQQPHIHYIA
jgi:hypothetical protein